MLNPEEASIQLKKYFRKLLKTINEEASFTLLKVKIINKKKIDDILCCIDATFPDDYKEYVKKNGMKRLKSAGHYQQLVVSIRRKVWFDSNSYDVLYKDAIALIEVIISTIDNDIRKVYSAQSSMF